MKKIILILIFTLCLSSVSLAENKKIVYLTFDDGPSKYTEELLDILNEYNAKSTFFVSGKNNPNILKRIHREGHIIGNHSYSHKYNYIYKSNSNFMKDYKIEQDYIKNITGLETTFYRFPGGSNNKMKNKTDRLNLIKKLNKQNIWPVDWNVSVEDAVPGKNLSVDQKVELVLNGIKKYKKPVILLHDTKKDTPLVIKKVLEKIGTEYEFKGLDDNSKTVVFIK